MHDKKYYTITAIIFSVIAIAHIGRIIFALEATIAGYDIPLWFSGAFIIIAGYLAVRGFHAARRM